jgi:hypothetical protein
MEQLLSKHPTIGVFSSIGGSILPTIEALTPLLQFSGLVIGLLIGAITLALKINEWKDKNNGMDKQ